VYLAFLVKVFESEEEFPTNDGNMGFVEGTRFELQNVSCLLEIDDQFIPNPSMSHRPRTP
jgi:hypothetical protein